MARKVNKWVNHVIQYNSIHHINRLRSYIEVFYVEYDYNDSPLFSQYLLLKQINLIFRHYSQKVR